MEHINVRSNVTVEIGGEACFLPCLTDGNYHNRERKAHLWGTFDFSAGGYLTFISLR